MPGELQVPAHALNLSRASSLRQRSSALRRKLTLEKQRTEYGSIVMNGGGIPGFGATRVNEESPVENGNIVARKDDDDENFEPHANEVSEVSDFETDDENIRNDERFVEFEPFNVFIRIF